MFVESFHGDIVNNAKNCINKPFSERFSIYIFLLSKFRVLSRTELVINEYVGGGGRGKLNPLPLAPGVGTKHLGPARVNLGEQTTHDLLCKYISLLPQSIEQPGGYSNKPSPYICNLLKSVHA